MKILGVTQFQKKKFKFLGFDGEWLEHVGNLEQYFIGIIYGRSGNGKTEYCVRFAKYLCQFGTVAWLSYEQGHDSDFQMAINRNKMEEVQGKFFLVDPLQRRNAHKTMFEELDEYLNKRNTPDFVFIDSVDYLRLTVDEYYQIKEKYRRKKGIVFLSHEQNNMPKSPCGKAIEYDGKFSFFVKKFIAHNRKNRIGGRGDYIIWEEEARRIYPLYFKNMEKDE